MYPIRLGYEQANARIQRLIDEEFYAEALVTSVFTFEKTVRRMVRTCVIARGFRSKDADVLLERASMEQLKSLLPCFEQDHRTLPEIVGGAWPAVKSAIEMRNKLVHGVKVFNATECKASAQAVMEATSGLRADFVARVGVDVWARLPSRRISALPFNLPDQSDFVECSDKK